MSQQREAHSEESKDDGVDYWPMFRASCLVALLGLATQILSVIWIALQNGATVSIVKFWFLPVLQVQTADIATFTMIVKWSVLITAAVVTPFVGVAFLRGHRLQIQMGRSFGLLDIAIFGLINIATGFLDSGFGATPRWIYYLTFAMLLAFAVATWLVNDAYKNRSEQTEEQELLPPIGAAISATEVPAPSGVSSDFSPVR